MFVDTGPPDSYSLETNVDVGIAEMR